MITAEEARAMFEYDPESGLLTYKTPRGKRTVGGRAGSLYKKENSKWYRRVVINGVKIKEHRLIWLIVHGEFPPKNIDHIDGNGANNKLSNLRLAEQKENARNKRKPRNNTSGTVGVYYDSSRVDWYAEIYIDGVKRKLGRYKQKHDAIAARKRAEQDIGYHPNHGSDRPL